MGIEPSLAALIALSGLQQAPAPQAQVQLDPQIIAQAADRCMATHAVRSSRTSTDDEAIYAQARLSCAPLNDQLAIALRARLAPAQAAEALRTLDAQAKPNFMAMIARIRSDRARHDAGTAGIPAK
ncbi:hypothetical protein RZN05_13015 [Sphingomonas sp. HF-S4]|uniref:DUF4168 domain-containing protein n=1 Tax=Sphingomonas agrestis TaxID=3080540 RepID=A0ABU3Y967_9SPHN|nr:hypothetical protein [Sphingomonas sp. HF-S4]MDV3457909.1 hypothetical protein [Sphingomonas sp. HF-S4]